MRILLFGQWYRPEPAYGLQDIAQVLIKKGHDVTVLTGFPNYPSGKLYPGYRIKHWQKEQLNGVPVVRVPLYPDHSKGKIRRTINYLSFMLSSSMLGPFLIPKPDVMFVYHPPLTVGVAAYVMSRVWKIPFVYQIQDMWPETLQATGMLHNPKILNGIDRVAKWVYAKADAICVISPGFRDNLIQKGVQQHKIHTIPNWVDLQKYHPAPANTEKARKLGLDGHFNIMFAGNIGEAQGLETLVSAAMLLRKTPAIQFVLVGDGIAVPRLKALSKKHNLNNIRFLGRFPAEEMSELYALADVLLVHLKDDPLFRITIPHKILSYLAVGKPILSAVKGDASDVVQHARAGLTCPPEDANALAATALQFYEMPDAERTKMGRRGLDAAQTHFEKETLITQIETLMQSLIAVKTNETI